MNNPMKLKPRLITTSTRTVCNSLSIQVLVDTCTMRHLNYQKTLDTTLLIANLFRSHELNARLTENASVLPETVGFKAEAVDEEGIWRPYTVEDISNDSMIDRFV